MTEDLDIWIDERDEKVDPMSSADLQELVFVAWFLAAWYLEASVGLPAGRAPSRVHVGP
jgi:hypothetical protein